MVKVIDTGLYLGQTLIGYIYGIYSLPTATRHTAAEIVCGRPPHCISALLLPKLNSGIIGEHFLHLHESGRCQVKGQ